MALSYEEQREVLPDFVEDNIEEDVVSVFDNAFKLVPQLMDEEKLSYKAVGKIISCFVLMDLNISNTDLNEDAFKHNELWVRVRTLAKEALIEMNEPLTRPNIDLYFDD